MIRIEKGVREKLKKKGYKIATEEEFNEFFLDFLRAPDLKEEIILKIQEILMELKIPPTVWIVPLEYEKNK